MSNFASAYKLMPHTEKLKVLCPGCVKKPGHIISLGCHVCGGKGFINKSFLQYKVAAHREPIYKIDRDPKTGCLRYWTNMSEFYFESVTPDLNKYVPRVPHGIHLIHFTHEQAEIEANRINNYLKDNSIDD